MVNKSAPDAIFNKNGLTLHIKRNSGKKVYFKALLQPLRYKNKIYLRGVATELGYDSLKKYLLISPADIDLSAVDGVSAFLYHGNNHLSIDHTETVYFGKKPCYNWSIVSKEE